MFNISRYKSSNEFKFVELDELEVKNHPDLIQMVDEFKEKQKKTMMQKYGAEHPMRVPSIREKIESTNLEKYGHRCTLGSKEVYEKALKTKYKNVPGMESVYAIEKSKFVSV